MGSKKKYIIKIRGGLGNQMFGYAFYKKLRQQYPDKTFLLDFDDCFDNRFDRNVELLHVFPKIKVDEADTRLVIKNEHRIPLKYRGIGSRYVRNIVDFINANILKSPSNYKVTEAVLKSWRNVISEDKWDEIKYFDGFWQDINLYKDMWSDILMDFEYRDLTDNDNLNILNDIKGTESVSVHVRRGDYSGDYKFDILDTAYYSKIIKKIQNEAPNSIFYFFSNDAEYVRSNYSWLESKVVVEINSGEDSYKDMQLMSACKTNIVANSTFSLWACFLNKNENRKVYYPSYYFRNERPLDFSFLEGFYKVDNEIK